MNSSSRLCCIYCYCVVVSGVCSNRGNCIARLNMEKRKCWHCGMEFSCVNDYVSHMNGNFYGEICPNQSENAWNSAEKYICRRCELSFADVYALRKHVMGADHCLYWCNFCNYIGKNIAYYNLNIMKNHDSTCSSKFVVKNLQMLSKCNAFWMKHMTKQMCEIQIKLVPRISETISLFVPEYMNH